VKIAYILIQMPAPSEVFLAIEVRGLIQLGNVVNVISLRSPHPDYDKLVAGQNLRDVDLWFYPFFSLQSLVDMARSPFMLLHMVWMILRTCWRKPDVALRSLAILPKSFTIARVIARENFDAVHFAWGHYPAVTAYLIERMLPNLPLTLALGAYDRMARHPMTVIAANHADHVLTQSDTNADLIKNDFPRTTTPVTVIYRGVELQGMKQFRGEKKTLGLIVSAARLLPIKGHHFLIRAMPKILQAVPHARLIIYGMGDYQPELEKLIVELGLTDVVTLGGYLSHEKLFRAVAQANVFALVSDNDSLPNSVKEAMALGVPVVTTPTTGMSELIQDGETGLIAPCGDVDAIADRLIAVLSDPALAERLRNAAMRSVEKFDVQQTSEQRHLLYLRLMQGYQH